MQNKELKEINKKMKCQINNDLVEENPQRYQ